MARFSEKTLTLSRANSSAGWLELAIEAEFWLKKVGPFDPAFSKFANDMSVYMKMAEAAESENR